MLFYQKIPQWLQRIFGHLTWQLPNDRNDIYLTFDDGPHPEITPWVLDQLEAHNSKATFFCVGDNVKKFPETYQRILNAGHRTGNHTMNHLKGWQTDTDTYLENVMNGARYINSELFRPPYGRIRSSQIKLIEQRFKIIMWSLLSCDFEKNLNTNKAMEGLIRNTKSGSIIVFHDSVKSEKNLKIMLPLYLQFLNEKGFNCKSL